MKKILLLFFFNRKALGLIIVNFLVCFSSPDAIAQAPYCTPSYTEPCIGPGVNDFIDNFWTTGAAVNVAYLNSGCSMQPNNYSLVPQTLSIALGDTFTINVQAGAAYSQGFGIWIDYNQNNSFLDSGEFVYNTGVSGSSVFWDDIFVPVNANSGATRMRVRSNYNVPPTDPCTNQTYGEVEDYYVNIGVTGVPSEKNSKQMFNIYPNPTFDIINITLDERNKINTAFISNIMGEKIKEIDMQNLKGNTNYSFDVKEFTPGIYFLTLQSIGMSETKKIIVH